MFEKIKSLALWNKNWVQFLVFVLKRFERDHCRDLAGSLTYTTLFAVVPMLTVFLVIISSIKALEPVRQKMQGWIYSNFLPKTSIAFDKTFNSFAENSSNLTAVGVVFLFVTAVMMLSTIEQAFNRIWRVSRSRGGIMGFMRYWTIISLGPILLGTAFALSSAVTSLKFLNATYGGYQLDFAFILSVASFVLTCLGITLLYWTIPNRTVPFRAALIAGVFSGVVFALVKNLFGFIMSNFTSYELVYGAFAAVPIFLLWIYTSWVILLLGVEVSFALTAFASKTTIKRHPVLMFIDILELFYLKQNQGQTVTEKELLQILGREEIGRLPHYLDVLEQQKIVAQTSHAEYALIRNLNHVDFWDFFIQLPYQLPHRKDLGNIHRDDRWMQIFGPKLNEVDEILSNKLAIPIASIFERSKL